MRNREVTDRRGLPVTSAFTRKCLLFGLGTHQEVSTVTVMGTASERRRTLLRCVIHQGLSRRLVYGLFGAGGALRYSWESATSQIDQTAITSITVPQNSMARSLRGDFSISTVVLAVIITLSHAPASIFI